MSIRDRGGLTAAIPRGPARMRRRSPLVLFLALAQLGALACDEGGPVCERMPERCQPFVVSRIGQPDFARAVDITFVADGYLAGDLPEFLADAEQLRLSLANKSRHLTALEPTLFNFYAVGVPSATREVENDVTKDTAAGGHLVPDPKGGRPLIEVDR